ncbi:AAA family ATPase [Chamaesiphon polymorphus]|uniref:Nuclease SbcCD subunit C n=1 Tax=Chamaesiphon polymorphus CCALA 037 TaxID=2107692 RepID=A0A2T1G547_9CYAN|nr:AAA family ATPase [Chamaesiphon polymorphus]PSB52371.1 ATP-binding protein [Chamaesiphon polymorphus CCALA 037]
MKLTAIRLCNFRQFYGETPEVRLATDNDRNTTIVHGNNGAGKTTLLNAFTWVLYEKFTAAFAESQQLVNKRAIAEAEIGTAVDTWVEVAWEHDGKRYRAKRMCRAYKQQDTVNIVNNELLYLYIGDADGKWLHPQQPPDEIIGRILPASLHQYFFFDGERIEQIVRQDKRLEIAEATKILLGVEVLNRSIKHLGEAKKTLETELAQIGDTATKDLLRSQQQCQQEIDNIESRQAEIDREIANFHQIEREINNYLLELTAATAIQQQRQELESTKAIHQTQLRQAQTAIKQLISTQAYTVLLPNLTQEFQHLVAELRDRGELNQGISREFIARLIQHQNCLCGAELHPDTPAYLQIQTWLSRASIAVIEETTMRLITQVEDLQTKGDEFWQAIDLQQQIVTTARSEISQLEIQIDRLETQLRQDTNIEISNLQKRLDDIEIKVRDLILTQGQNKQQIVHLEGQVQSLAKQITKQQANQDRQSLAQRRLQATRSAIEELIVMRDRQEQQFRIELERQVQRIFQTISVTPYLPKITEKYELILVENTRGVETIVAASTGENQILSLSFIGGIIDRVREWSEQKLLAVPQSNTFPIVMDSPFGSLDRISRRQIAQILPQLASQLVVLVTKTQWRDEVETEMQSKIGKQYVLTYYTSKLDSPEDYLEIDRQRYPLIQHSPNDFDYTEIVEIV